MKRLLLYLLTMMVTVVAMAKDVTPEEALQKATQFVAKRHAARVQRAPGTAITTPQLELTGQVSGLYLFNVSNAGGYVIVSPDDCTEAILGYSDSGNIDPQHMPENMRAWLQGYADQIAWARQNNIQASNAPRRASREAVAPLLRTYWDQGEPFNNLCPAFGSENTVTGCVATAMAQVMYYTAKKAGQTSYTLTTDIPGYTTQSLGLTVDGVAAGATLDWSQMQDAYGYYKKDGSWINEPYTNAAATAVAQLMYYCGVSVQMDYNIGSNGGSGASATYTEKALRTYFGYDETVQWLDRNVYSADNWEELVYHEISNGRPVLYGGQSTGGGHAFVCDGYRTDGYFHINWGWSGSSNNYFLLSALDPEEQGFGGSSTNTGFNSQQEAVIGIQLKGAGGTVSPAVSTASGVSLKLLSMSINENPTIIGHEVTVTARITNNSKDDYNSYLGIADLGTGYVLYANAYQIASGKTKDCDITFPASEEGTKKLDLIYYNDGYWRWGLEFEITIYPKNVTKSMNAYGWATLSSKYPLDFSETGLTPYIVTGSKGKLVEKTEITKAPGGIGLLIKGEPNQIFTIPVTLETTDDVTGNLMVPVIDAEVIVTKSDDATKENYVLSVDNEGEKAVFARVNADAATVEVGKAYLTLPASPGNAPFLSFDDEEGTTGIKSLTPTLSQEEGVYTLDGRKLNGIPTAKGVYIVNGQKVVIK